MTDYASITLYRPGICQTDKEWDIRYLEEQHTFWWWS